MKVSFKPDAKKLGPRAGKYLKAIAQALSQADPKSLLNGRSVHGASRRTNLRTGA